MQHFESEMTPDRIEPNCTEGHDRNHQAPAPVPEYVYDLGESSFSPFSHHVEVPGAKLLSRERLLVTIIQSLESPLAEERLAASQVLLGQLSSHNSEQVAHILQTSADDLFDLVVNHRSFVPTERISFFESIKNLVIGSDPSWSRCHSLTEMRIAALDSLEAIDHPDALRILRTAMTSDSDRDVQEFASKSLHDRIRMDGTIGLAEGVQPLEAPTEALRTIAEADRVLSTVAHQIGVEVVRPGPEDIESILRLYARCSGELVLKVPNAKEQVENILNRLFIARDKESKEAVGLLEIWTLENGGLREERLDHYLSGPETLYFEPEIAERLINNMEQIAYTKRVLVDPDYRGNGLSGVLRGEGWQTLLAEGYRDTAGFLRFNPRPNFKSLVAHMIKKGGANPVGLLHKEENGEEFNFIVVHDELIYELQAIIEALKSPKQVSSAA